MLKLVVFLIALIFSSDADAAVRSYSAPKQNGTPVATCLPDGQSCGKPAADQFCKAEGFSESILFAREKDTQVFTRIKCYRAEVVAEG
jgi:hypothetical protein